jgi:hypothetical protein
MFGPKGTDVIRTVRDLVNRSFMVCAGQQILFGRSNKEDEMDGAFDTYEGEKECRQGSGGDTSRKEITLET